MLRHRALVIAVAGLAVAAVPGLVACSSGSSPGAVSTVVTPLPGRLTSQQVGRLEQRITASTATSEAAVIAPGVRAQFLRNGRTLLPAGAHLRIDAATFRETSAGTATVDAVVSGPASGRWLLLLVRESGQWLLIGTRRQ